MKRVQYKFNISPGLKGYKTFFMFNSTKHDISGAYQFNIKYRNLKV